MVSAQRTVRFFEVVADNDKSRLPNDLDFLSALEVVRDLTDDDAYVGLDRMEVLGSPHVPHGAGARGRVGMLTLDRITRDVRLRIQRRRNYRPLVLEDDETLAEPTFYSLFPGNVLAVLRNSGQAPGPASFRDYINAIGVFDMEIDVSPWLTGTLSGPCVISNV